MNDRSTTKNQMKNGMALVIRVWQTTFVGLLSAAVQGEALAAESESGSPAGAAATNVQRGFA